jgi:hypothetical protein
MGLLAARVEAPIRIVATAAIKFRIDNPAAPRSLNPMTLWIAKETGLPLYHEVNGLDGGFASVFGDAVKEPAAKK